MKFFIISLTALLVGACATTPQVEKRTPAQNTQKPTEWIREYSYNTGLGLTIDAKVLGGKFNIYDCSGVEVPSAANMPSARIFAKTDGEAFIKYVELLSQPADGLLKINIDSAGKVEILGHFLGGGNGGVQIKCFLIKQL